MRPHIVHEGPSAKISVELRCENCIHSKHVGGSTLPTSNRSIHRCEKSGTESSRLLDGVRIAQCPFAYDVKLAALEAEIRLLKADNMKKALGK